jgi:hypothetical protein
MCMMRSPTLPNVTAAPAIIAAPNNAEATFQADMAARMRRARAGAAANVLTGPTGIPSTPTLGGVAA